MIPNWFQSSLLHLLMIYLPPVIPPPVIDELFASVNKEAQSQINVDWNFSPIFDVYKVDYSECAYVDP